MTTFAADRVRMVDEQLRRRGIRDTRVLEAFLMVPREEFVPPELVNDAYADTPLPIGYGQTISQPYVVALSLQLLGLTGDEHALEVGAGCGYASCLLAHLAGDVIGVERIGELAQRAMRTLERLGVHNARILAMDGSRGVPAYAPYDAILVSASAPSLPMALYHELTGQGRLVAPIGGEESQRLELVRPGPDGPTLTTSLAVRFVPLVGDDP